MIVRRFNASVIRPILCAYAVAGALAAATVVVAACYPKNCDPKTDPLRCQCPPGVCGPYPEPMPPPPVRGADGGLEAGR